MEGVVHVDAAGAIRVVERWPWSEAPTLGTAIAELFAPEAQDIVRTLASWGWVGVQEHALEAAAGIIVRMWAEPAGEHVRLAMRDVSDLVVLRDMTEQRRIGARLADLAGSLAGDLSDPMSVLFGRLEFMQNLGRVSSPADLAVLYQNTRRMVAVLHNLRSVGRFPGPSLQPASVAEAMNDALALLGDLAPFVRLRLSDGDVQVACEREVVTHLVASLVWRAIESLGQVQLELLVRRGAGGVEIELRTERPRAWNPAGTFANAALVQILLASVGGSITALDRPSILLTLPLPAARPQRPRRGTRRILVVGAHIGAHVQHLLGHDPVRVVPAARFDDAIPMLDTVDTVITELVLEGRYSGRTLAEIAVRRGLLCVVVADREIPPRALPRGAHTLQWPAAREALLAVLRTPNPRPH